MSIPQEETPAPWAHYLRRAMPLWGVLLFASAVVALYFNLRDVHWHEFREALRSVPASTLVLAALVTAFAYGVLTWYELLALAYVGKKQPLRRAALASFTSWAFCNTVGYALLSGGVMRYRLYSRWGLTAVEIAQVAVFCSLSAVLGLVEMGGFGLLLGYGAEAVSLQIKAMLLCLLGLGLVALPMGYVFGAGRLAHTPELAAELPRVPAFGIRAGQLVMGCIDFFSTLWVLYVLLPPDMALSIAGFVGIYIAAVLFGEASQVPGGIGIVDAALFTLLKPYCVPEQLAASLVLYRLYYFVAPLALAATMVGLYELRDFLRSRSEAF